VKHKFASLGFPFCVLTNLFQCSTASVELPVIVYFIVFEVMSKFIKSLVKEEQQY